jgi:hypothetical protein
LSFLRFVLNLEGRQSTKHRRQLLIGIALLNFLQPVAHCLELLLDRMAIKRIHQLLDGSQPQMDAVILEPLFLVKLLLGHSLAYFDAMMAVFERSPTRRGIRRAPREERIVAVIDRGSPVGHHHCLRSRLTRAALHCGYVAHMAASALVAAHLAAELAGCG